jgi:hypothetical protein
MWKDWGLDLIAHDALMGVLGIILPGYLPGPEEPT